MTSVPTDRLALAGWRRAVAELYATVRSEPDVEAAHAMWRDGRDDLFRHHPESPLGADDPLRRTGLPYWPYDPALRFVVPLLAAPPERREVPTSTDGVITLERIGRAPVATATLDVWWIAQYGGGIFVPLRDATAGTETYGGGRYLLDTAKGADLGGDATALVLDVNFAYHPSCRYDPRWECPLAPDGNQVDIALPAGERLAYCGGV